MHVFGTKQNTILVNVFTVQSVNTRKHYTAQEKKLKVLAFSLFFSNGQAGFTAHSLLSWLSDFPQTL